MDKSLCLFCSTGSGTAAGELVASEGFTIHTHCLFAASELGQHGNSEKDGIMGFWVEDILQTFELSKENRCEFCGMMGATIFCAECQVVTTVYLQTELMCRVNLGIFVELLSVNSKVSYLTKKFHAVKPSYIKFHCTLHAMALSLASLNSLNFQVLWLAQL